MVFVPKVGIFDPISGDDLDKIHAASLEILEEIGVIVEDDATLKMLHEAGALVDWRARNAKIPVAYIPSPLSELTAPVTTAGMTAQANAKALSGIVIIQLTNN